MREQRCCISASSGWREVPGLGNRYKSIAPAVNAYTTKALHDAGNGPAAWGADIGQRLILLQRQGSGAE